jgi:hypothetical protein
MSLMYISFFFEYVTICLVIITEFNNSFYENYTNNILLSHYYNHFFLCKSWNFEWILCVSV